MVTDGRKKVRIPTLINVSVFSALSGKLNGLKYKIKIVPYKGSKSGTNKIEKKWPNTFFIRVPFLTVQPECRVARGILQRFGEQYYTRVVLNFP